MPEERSCWFSSDGAQQFRRSEISLAKRGKDKRARRVHLLFSPKLVRATTALVTKEAVPKPRSCITTGGQFP